MKFAGVHMDKKNRGEVIEFTPEQKIVPAVIMAVANYDPDYAMWATDVKHTSFRFSPSGDLFKKKFQNNNYYVEGTATFCKRRREGDVQLEPKVGRFTLQFADKMSEMGLPEFEIKKFVIN